MSTNNPAAAGGWPEPEVLARLANEFFAALPGGGVAAPAAGFGAPLPTGLPAEKAPRGAPAALAGAAGLNPQWLAGNNAPAALESLPYLLESAQPGSPHTPPLANPAPPGFEPPLGLVLPATLTQGNPRSWPGHSAVPGSHLGSTAPKTPGWELGAQPGAGAVPPASAFAAPGAAELRDLPTDPAGAAGKVPHGTVLAAGTPLPAYFLDPAHPLPPGGATAIDLKPRDAGIEILPYLGLADAPGAPQSVPGSLSSAQAVPAGVDARRPAETSPPAGSPHTAASPASDVSYYFLDELLASTATPSQPAAEKAQHSGLEEAAAHPAFDPYSVRADFPILQERVHGRPLVWLDNAATTQKPLAVIERLDYFYRHENSNIHRAAHELAARATDAYEAARDKSARFLHAASSDEIVFVRGATEAINLVAQSWGRRNVGAGDEIVITWLEHHANIVPWQQLCAESGARLRVAPVDDRGQVLLDEYEKLFNSRTKLASFTQVSNALGTITPAKEMVEIAHRHGARVLVDGAQAVSHLPVDVQSLDCDWYVFSGHKVFGPTGIGVLFGKGDVLNATPPWQGGGNMIQDVTFEKTVYQPAPARFEAGTGNIADAVGLGAALDYVERLGRENIARYEHDLLHYATLGLSGIPGLRLIGTAQEKAGVLSFVLDGFRSEDVGAALNREGIAVRSGHHCAQPILRRFGVEAAVRPSLALYNTCEDVDALVAAVLRLQANRTPRL